MKAYIKPFLLLLGLFEAVAHAGALHVSNSKGFDSNPVVDNNGTVLTAADPVWVAIGTFASEPATALPGSSLGIDSTTYAALLAGFTPYGAPVGLEASTPPLARRGTFVFQDNQAVAGSPLVDKPVYLLIAKGTGLAAATEVAILRTTASFAAADDINPVPKLVGVGTGLGSVVIVGSASRFTAAPTGLSSTQRSAYSLASILPPAEIVVEQPAGNGLVNAAATVDFGLVALGSNSERTFRIRNTGDGSLDLNGSPVIELSGPSAAQFAVTSPPVTPILSGGETFFTIRFSASIAGNASATLQIASNDPDENPFSISLIGNGLLPTVTLIPPAAAIAEDGPQNLVFTVMRNGPVNAPLSVNFMFDGTAEFGSDYSQNGAATFFANSGTINFAPGSDSAVIVFDPSADNAVEPDETIAMTLGAGTGYHVGVPASGSGTIANDDTTVSVAVLPSLVIEDGAANLMFTFSRAGATGESLTVGFGVDGTAVFGSDFTQSGAASFSASAGTVTFPAGSTTAVVTIHPVADAIVEPDETVILTLGSGIAYEAAAPASAAAIIANDDAYVSVTVAPASMIEGGGGMVFTFTREGLGATPLTTHFSVSGSAVFGNDYQQSGATDFSTTAGTVNFDAGQITAQVTINPKTDAEVEVGESVVLTVTPGSGYLPGAPSSASGTILNGDLPEIGVEQPLGSAIADGDTRNFGTVVLGSQASLSFTIHNTGTGELTGLDITRDGPDAAMFAVTSSLAGTIAAGGSATFSVQFTPVGSGSKSATLHIASNDADENPYEIILIGNGINPEIVVEQPVDTDIADGGTRSFGTVLLGGTVDLVFTVKNTGDGDLKPLTLSKDGVDAGAFVIVTGPTAPLAGSGGMTSFTIRFVPTASGAKSATLQIASNDADESTFDINLAGQALSPNDDTDGDGLNDAAEFQLAALGYDWQVSQPALVGTLFANSNLAGLYTQGQVRALHAGTPMIARNPATGRFTLTMDWKKSLDLQNFSDFPAQPGDVSVNQVGDILYEFTSPDDAAFFRLESE